MRKIESTPVGAADLIAYLSESSDFGFELRTLKLLRLLKLECEHGGLYEDPVTKVLRQFDIRATARAGAQCVRLAVECKNIGESFPLLVTCVPRHEDESFHEIAIVGEIEQGSQAHGMYESRAHVVKLRDHNSMYRSRSPVGKDLAQVGREATVSKSIYSASKEIYEKWSQGLSSAHDLITASYWEGASEGPGNIAYVAVLPIVVVPDGCLWTVQYDSDGVRTGEPVKTERCSYFVNTSYRMSLDGPTLSLSHVEFVTLTGLETFVSTVLAGSSTMESIFPKEPIESAMEDLTVGHYYG